MGLQTKFESCGALSALVFNKQMEAPQNAAERLMSLIVRFETSQCALIRDKVFTLCGLAEERTVLEIDYNRPMDSILLEVLTAEQHMVHTDEIWRIFTILYQDPGQLPGRILDIRFAGNNSKRIHPSNYKHQQATNVDGFSPQDISDLKLDWTRVPLRWTTAITEVHKCNCVSCNLTAPSGVVSTCPKMEDLTTNDFTLAFIKDYVFSIYRHTKSVSGDGYAYPCSAIIMDNHNEEMIVYWYYDHALTCHIFVQHDLFRPKICNLICIMAHSLPGVSDPEREQIFEDLAEGTDDLPLEHERIQQADQIMRLYRNKVKSLGAHTNGISW